MCIRDSALCLLVAFHMLIVLPFEESGSESEEVSGSPEPPAQEDAAKKRDADILRQLGELISACPTCDRVLADDEVWHHAASWMSRRVDLPRSPVPCPDCQKIRNSP